MHKLALTLLLVLMIGASASAQHSPLIPYAKGKLYGFADTTGKIVVTPAYDKIAYGRNSSYLEVSKNGKYGALHPDGSPGLELIYDKIQYLSNNLLIVRESGKYGIVTLDGKMIQPLRYERIDWLQGGYLKVALRKKDQLKLGLLTLDGTEVLPARYDKISRMRDDFILVQRKGKYGVMRRENDELKEFIPAKYQRISYEGRIPRFMLDRDGSEIEVRDKNLVLVERIPIPKTEDRALTESMEEETVSEAAPPPPPPPPPKSSVTGNSGQIGSVDAAAYDYVSDKNEFSNFILVRKDGKWGALTKNNEIYLPVVYDSIDVKKLNFQNFHFKPYRQHFMVKKDGKWGIVGSKAKFRKAPDELEVLVPFLYDGFDRNYNNSCIFPILDGKYGAITGSNFKLVLPPEYPKLYGPTKIAGFTVYNTASNAHNKPRIYRYIGHNGVRFYED